MLNVSDLSITFTMYDVGLVQKSLTVVTGLDLEVQAGELVAIIGASGSGKSLLAHALLGILPHNAQVTGKMTYKGQPLTPDRQAALRGNEITLIPQTVAALDPLQQVGARVRRAAVLAGADRMSAQTAQEQVFKRYALEDRVRRLYPFQVSGGMARRVLMATATVTKADLLIADEPTPGLNPAVVTETLNHLRELANEGKGVVLITHDISAALRVADKIAVFYAGMTVETARAADFAGDGSALRHPYTQALWRALPQNGMTPIGGTQPSPAALPPGCLFAARCPVVTAACHGERPPARALRGGTVRCIHA